MHSRKNNSKNIIGKKFERFVMEIFNDLDYLNIKHNKRLQKYNLKLEFDIITGYIFKNYIECKYKSPRYKVTKKDASDFVKRIKKFHKIKTKDNLANIVSFAFEKHYLITNTYFTKNAKDICKKHKIITIDRNRLEALDYKRMNLIDSIKYKLAKTNRFNFINYNLEQRIKNTKI